MASPEVIGRYAVYGKIAAGGMATVHLGRLLGPVGFSRTVAIKRMLPQFTQDQDFVSMFLDEARLAARLRHPNVVPTLDVVANDRELFLVLEYVQGETLARLVRGARDKGEHVPVAVVAAIGSGVLHGLHSAHEAKNERGEPLGIVHRDISPQNIIVGLDGVPRVLDFGIAKAVGRLQTTRDGQLKGKISYMAPEQVEGALATRRSDVYATSVVLWEALTGRRLIVGETNAAMLHRVLSQDPVPPSHYAPSVGPEIDAVVLRGLSRNPADRFASAKEMASALEAAVSIAIAPVVGAWVERIAGAELATQAQRVADMEHDSGAGVVADAGDPSLLSTSGERASVTLAASDGVASGSLAHADTVARPSLTVPHDATAEAAQPSQVSFLSVASPVTGGTSPSGLGRRRGVAALGVVLAIAAGIGLLAVRSRAPAGAAPPNAATEGVAAPSAPASVVLSPAPPLEVPPVEAPAAPGASTATPPSMANAIAGHPARPSPAAVRPVAAPRRSPADRPAVASSATVSAVPTPTASAAYNPFDHL